MEFISFNLLSFLNHHTIDPCNLFIGFSLFLVSSLFSLSVVCLFPQIAIFSFSSLFHKYINILGALPSDVLIKSLVSLIEGKEGEGILGERRRRAKTTKFSGCKKDVSPLRSPSPPISFPSSILSSSPPFSSSSLPEPSSFSPTSSPRSPPFVLSPSPKHEPMALPSSSLSPYYELAPLIQRWKAFGEGGHSEQILIEIQGYLHSFGKEIIVNANEYVVIHAANLDSERYETGRRWIEF